MEQILISQLFAALYGFTGVLLGAFGAHVLRNKLEAAQLQSFETAVRYQLIHAVVLLILSFNLSFTTDLDIHISRAFILGTFFFSFSIYALVWSNAKGKKWRFLGPVTPAGGLMLLLGWALLGYSFIANLL